jgi:hypothetical protein
MLPPAEQAVIGRALAVVPQDRWNSCTEMMDRLEEAARLESVAK